LSFYYDIAVSARYDVIIASEGNSWLETKFVGPILDAVYLGSGLLPSALKLRYFFRDDISIYLALHVEFLHKRRRFLLFRLTKSIGARRDVK
jgi:hypothetical protein